MAPSNTTVGYTSMWDMLYADKALVRKIEHKSELMMRIEDYLVENDVATPDYEWLSELVKKNVEDVKLSVLVDALELIGLDITVQC